MMIFMAKASSLQKRSIKEFQVAVTITTIERSDIWYGQKLEYA